MMRDFPSERRMFIWIQKVRVKASAENTHATREEAVKRAADFARLIDPDFIRAENRYIVVNTSRGMPIEVIDD